MVSIRFSPKRTEKERSDKVPSDSGELSFDLLSNLTYMAALSTGGTSRDMILRRAIKQDFKTTSFFEKVYLLAKRLGFEYVRAFQLVAAQTRADSVRSLLLRFASSIGSGESEQDFLLQEARIEREKYVGDYSRKVESLQKWGEAYAAFLVSSTLIVVVALISTMLYDLGTGFILALAGTMFLMSCMGVFVIYASAPYEVVAHKEEHGPIARRRAVRMFVLAAPMGAVTAVVVALAQTTVQEGLGWALIAFGASLVPAGVFAYVDDMRVRNVDAEVAGFVRALGAVTASLGSTLTVGVQKLDRRSMGAMEPYLERLQGRLNGRLSPEVCWERFTDETGSALVNRTMRMFVDGVSVGGSPDVVGTIATDYAMNVALLRAKRRASALPFAFLVIPLHTAMIGLLVFILEIMRSFNQRLLEAVSTLNRASSSMVIEIPNLPIFQPKDLGPVTYITMAVVLVLVVANSLVPKLALGGHRVLLLTYAPLTCLTAGANLLIIPPLAATLLAS